MRNDRPIKPTEPDRDLIDEAMELPLVGAGISRLQRVLGPSCLTSLVLLLILTVLFRRWIHLPPIGMLMLLLILWMLILGIMTRFRNPDPDGEYQSDEVIDREQ